MKACLFSCEFANAVRRSCDHMLFLPYSIVHGIFLSLNLLLNQTFFFFPLPPLSPLIVGMGIEAVEAATTCAGWCDAFAAQFDGASCGESFVYQTAEDTQPAIYGVLQCASGLLSQTVSVSCILLLFLLSLKLLRPS